MAKVSAEERLADVPAVVPVLGLAAVAAVDVAKLVAAAVAPVEKLLDGDKTASSVEKLVDSTVEVSVAVELSAAVEVSAVVNVDELAQLLVKVVVVEDSAVVEVAGENLGKAELKTSKSSSLVVAVADPSSGDSSLWKSFRKRIWG